MPGHVYAGTRITNGVGGLGEHLSVSLQETLYALPILNPRIVHYCGIINLVFKKAFNLRLWQGNCGLSKY